MIGIVADFRAQERPAPSTCWRQAPWVFHLVVTYSAKRLMDGFGVMTVNRIDRPTKGCQPVHYAAMRNNVVGISKHRNELLSTMRHRLSSL